MAEPTCPHCGTKITEHEAKPCLSAWIVEAAMGLRACMDRDCGGCDAEFRVDPRTGNLFAPFNDPRDAWHPHEDIAAAMEVLEVCGDYFVERGSGNAGELIYSVVIMDAPLPSDGVWGCEDPTLPLAICRAAILATAKEKTK